MLAPAAVLLLASYVGPAAAPDTNYAAPSTREKVERAERNNSYYLNPQNQPPQGSSMREADWSVRERAAEGRLVVPEKFR